MQVYINGKIQDMPDTMSFEDLRQYTGINRLPTITYYSGNKSGALAPGETLTLEPNMVLNVVVTDNS